MRHASLLAAVLLALSGVAPPSAAAAPPGFPDLSKFSAVDPAPYVAVVGTKSVRRIQFVAGQLNCSWELTADPNAHDGVSCSGDIPGIPDGVPRGEYDNSCDGISTGGAVGLYTFSRGTGPCPPPDGFRPVPVGAKITAASATCAVTPDGVACIDPIVNHGFVLQHPLSWVF